MTEDTIAAISTPIGEGGIAIVRVSGPHALKVADAVFQSKSGLPSTFPSHTVHFGIVIDEGNTVDQVLLTVMRSPNTFTGEDTVEINCHGGTFITRKVLQLCLRHSARLAEPGEFTKRAFLNGRLDLTQAEAVMDMIQAKTTLSLSAAEKALEGHLSKRIDAARDDLMSVIAHIEAHIDFPDDDIDAGTQEHWKGSLSKVATTLEKLLETAHEGKLLRQGVSIAIVGRPNSGKSSLMNALLGVDRSIVTPVAGTTRDTIEEFANIRGIPVKLTDTAGIRSARGLVERAGVERSVKSLNESDLLIHVYDGSRSFSEEDLRLRESTIHKVVISVINKNDLPRNLKLPDEVQSSISVSAKTTDGIETLKDKIEAVIWNGVPRRFDYDVAVNQRQAEVLRRALESVRLGMADLSAGSTPELVSQSLRLSLNALGEVVGKSSTEDILDKVFSTFCIGK